MISTCHSKRKSLFIILPFSPEPFTWERLIPFSSAIFLANGDANILDPAVFFTGSTDTEWLVLGVTVFASGVELLFFGCAGTAIDGDEDDSENYGDYGFDDLDDLDDIDLSSLGF